MKNYNNLERYELTRIVEKQSKLLGLRASCPYILVDASGSEIQFAAYLREFGSARGMLIDVVTEPDFMPSVDHKLAAEVAGVPISFVNLVSWRDDPREFVAALCDWGYFGRREDLSESLRELLPVRRK